MNVNTRIKTFGSVEDRVMEQLRRCCTETAAAAVLCADNHIGYSMPIGAGIAYRGMVSPSGVGYDIACGNKAVRTNIRADEVPDYGAVMDEITSRISFGMGRNNKEPVKHPVIDEIAGAPDEFVRKLGWMAEGQLGTVGSGNHYVDLFRDEDGWLWVGVHFGSRGFGHKVATGFLNLAHGRKFDERMGASMDAPPTLIPANSPLGESYVHYMEIAGRYAYAGRDFVVAKILEILGVQAIEDIHNHHNFAWKEEHNGERVWVVRKGCTPARPGQRSFVGGSMGEPAVIIEGLDGHVSREALYSTVHGAGRVMGRNQAAGRRKWVRDETGRKRMVRWGGIVNWQKVQNEMRERGIILRGGGADEAPEVYKRLDQVLPYHADTIRMLHTLTPIAVAMAGEDVEDLYKD